ncbi:MAG: thioredoxin domain-containing protein [bacterium]|nr:thioredoxin domain-containing protein [bacterium]MDT8395298.1 thioredoxin domain-containing protein [bacterium]
MNKTPGGKANRLSRSGSPYLLQHARNPVNWYPWSSKAFMKATAEDKPVLLSIGYSTCHWCHVMEAESFSDPEVAALLNETFVCIKVDREERPDLDHLFMNVCQQMTGTGGWPLNVIMTPDKKPFFAGTYFPRESSHGRMGMLELIPKVRDLWNRRRPKAVAAAEDVVKSICEALTPRPVGRPGKSLIGQTFGQMFGQFDTRHGGFGSAPKFPTPVNLLFLLHYGKRNSEPRAMEMVRKSLRAMRLGGIYDHIGGGIHRYSTDAAWTVPHFEKMLYDQALVSMAATEAYRATGEEEFKEFSEGILDFVLREMTGPDGGFYTAVDADSEGVEGRFYTWTPGEIEEVLDGVDNRIARFIFNLSNETGLIEGDGGSGERHVLFRSAALDAAAPQLGMSPAQLAEAVKKITSKLMEAREQRVRPFTDLKVQTDMNGLMIASLAKAAGAFDNMDYAHAAEKAGVFVSERMRGSEGQLLHIRYSEKATVPAFLDDYSYLLWGLMELYQATFRPPYLTGAISLAEEMIGLHWDDDGGGLFFSPRGSGPLPVRHKFAADGAVPSGNAVAAMNLLRIGRLTAKPDYEEKVAQIGKAFAGNMAKYPAAHAHLISVFNMALNSSAEVIITGDPSRPDTLEMVSALRKAYCPNMVAVFIPSTTRNTEVARLIPYARDIRTFEGLATAYVCKDFICRAPTTVPEEMIAAIEDVETGGP